MIRISLRLIAAAFLVLSITSARVSAVPAPEAAVAPAATAEVAAPLLNSTVYEVSFGLVHARVQVIDIGPLTVVNVERCWFGESLFLFNGSTTVHSDQGNPVLFQVGGRRFFFTPLRPDNWAESAAGGGLVFLIL